MLPAGARLRSSEDFRRVTRGIRVGRPTLVIHALPPAHSGDLESPRVGFVVSKALGGAVVRNRVKRRLRHLVAERMHADPLPDGALVVVRALPPAAAATTQLGQDLTSAWAHLGRKLAIP